MLSSLRSGIATESDGSGTAVDHGQVDGRRKTSSLENLHDFDGTVYIPVAEHLGEVPGRRPRTTELELENKRLQNDLFQTQNDLIKVKSKLFKCNLGRMSDEFIQTNSQKADRLSSNPGHNDITKTNSTFFGQKKEKLLVASIHIDNDYSCNGYSLKHKYHSDPMAISFHYGWPRGSRHPIYLDSRKVPTVILLNGDKTLHSFGYVAEDNYNELVLHEERENYHYFKRFTRRLHGKKIHRDIEVEDDLGRPIKAIIVFTETIRYLKQAMFTVLNERGAGLDNEDIHWVLTVPAIWSNNGKQFMREAAQKAGIDGETLTILSENEAVSLICQHISEDTKFQMSRPGTKFMVINAKGRTVELTVHERQADGGLTQLQQPSECEWSGYQVDKEFYNMIIKIVGRPLWSKFKDENTADYNELQRELETKKYRVTPESTGKITIKLPVKIKQMYEKERGENIKEAIDRSNYTGKITWGSDKLRIQAKVFQELFNPCTDKLVAHIKTLLHDPEVKDTKILFMVGTFSDSAMLQNAVKRAFPVCEVKIPDRADLCVLQAAVSFGHRPVCIATRVSKYTYGINISPPFDSTIHREDHRVPVGGIYRCRDVFKRYIQEGEALRLGEARSVTHATLKTNQKEMMLEIFASQNREPMYVDEKDCEYLGKIVVNLSGVDKILVEVKMMFGETELIVEAQELPSHMKYRAYFDFL